MKIFIYKLLKKKEKKKKKEIAIFYHNNVRLPLQFGIYESFSPE